MAQVEERGRDIVQNTHELSLDLLKLTFNYVVCGYVHMDAGAADGLGAGITV